MAALSFEEKMLVRELVEERIEINKTKTIDRNAENEVLRNILRKLGLFSKYLR